VRRCLTRRGLLKRAGTLGAAMKCTNMSELDRYVDRPYRRGWSLD